jgi:hypothetical protein
MDFVSERFANGLWFRIRTALDRFTRGPLHTWRL